MTMTRKEFGAAMAELTTKAIRDGLPLSDITIATGQLLAIHVASIIHGKGKPDIVQTKILMFTALSADIDRNLAELDSAFSPNANKKNSASTTKKSNGNCLKIVQTST